MKTHPRRGVGNVSVAPFTQTGKQLFAIGRAALWLSIALRGRIGDERSLMAIEHSAQVLAREVMGLVMQRQTAEPESDGPVLCPRCWRPMRLVGRRPREVVGVVGQWTVERRYWHCAPCRLGRSPWDETLGLGVGRLSPRLERAVCRQAVDLSFAAAAEGIEDLLGVGVDAEEVRRVSEGIGQVAESEEMARVAAIAAGEALEPGQALADTLVVEADGCMENVDGAWHEVKVGLVAPLSEQLEMDERAGRLRRKALDAHYVAGVREAPEAIFARLYAKAAELGLGGRGVRQVVVIGDGAPWIWQGAREYLGSPGVRVVEIIDIVHARQHLWAVANAVFGIDTAEAKRWATRQSERLAEAGVAPVMRALRRLNPKTVEGREAVRLGIGYFVERQDRMRYPEYVRAHLPIGSGGVESACKVLVQARQKQAGMRWRRLGSQAIATLRARQRSGEWEALWASEPHRRRPKARRQDQVRTAA